MAKSRFVQNNFVSGVLSPLLKGRTDLDQYYNGLETAENMVLMPQGGIRRRPGTEFINTGLPILDRANFTATMPNGGTGANISDEDDSTTTTTTTNISTVNPYIVAKLDLATARPIEVVDVRGIFLTSLSSTEFKVQYSTDDITYIDAATVPEITTGTQDFRLYVGTTARYWQLVRVGATDLGTDKITLSDFNVWTRTGGLSEIRLKDFSVSSSLHYLFVFSEGNCRIFNTATNAHVADVKTPYLSADVPDIRDIQSESVIVLFHEDHQTRRIINSGVEAVWSLDEAPYINVPQFDYNDSLSPTPTSEVQVLTFSAGWLAGDLFQLDIEGVFSKNITFAGDATADQQSATAFNIQKNIQDMPVVGDTGVTVARTGALAYTVTIAGESAKAFELITGFPTTGTAAKTLLFAKTATGVPRKEDVWSATRGYPKTACFYEGRLVIGGARSKPQSVFMSKSGSAYNFDIDEGDDDDGIFATISSRKLNNITDVFPGRNLQIFTDGSEFTVNISPVTPSTITITPQTSHGSLNIEAREIDGATIFADRNGKSIKQYLYSFNEDSYASLDLSVLTPELIKSPVDIAILGGTSSEDANWIFIVNTDGSATILNTLRDQDINGFTEWTTSGAISDVAVVDEKLYMVNIRTIDGVEAYYIERWDFNHYVDNGLTINNVAPLTTISGLDHLDGETVKVSAIDPANPLKVIVLDDRLVTAGDITLTAAESVYEKIQVGLPFTTTLKPMPLNTNIGSGANAMRRKKIVRMNMRVKDSLGIEVDGIPLPVRSFGEAAVSPLDTFPIVTTGVIDDILGVLGWNIDDMPTFTTPDATPITILAIEYEIESS